MSLAAALLLADASAAAPAASVLRFGGTPAEAPLVLRLMRLPVGWRIADIGADRDASLVRQLHAALDGERA